MPKGAVVPVLVLVCASSLDLLQCVVEQHADVRMQALVSRRPLNDSTISFSTGLLGRTKAIRMQCF